MNNPEPRRKPELLRHGIFTAEIHRVEPDPSRRSSYTCKVVLIEDDLAEGTAFCCGNLDDIESLSTFVQRVKLRMAEIEYDTKTPR